MSALLLGGCDKKKPEAPGAPAEVGVPAAPEPSVPKRVRATGQLGPGRGTLVVSLEPPENGKLTAGAPLVLEASGEHLEFPPRISQKLDPAQLPLRVPVDVADGARGLMRLKLSYYWCGLADGAACRPERAELEVELDTSGDAAGGEAHLSHRPRGS